MNIFEWLKENKYDYTWDVKIGNKTPDVIAFDDEKIVAFEIRRTSPEIAIAVKQCLQYLEKVNETYIILPSKEIDKLPENTLKAIEKKGIGLIEANEKIKVIFSAKKIGSINKKFLEKLKERSLSKPIDSNKDFEKKIINLLSKHPEGLTTIDISKILGIHRHTATKYVNQLVESEKIYQRQVGPAKLCYLSKKEEKE